MRTFKKWPQLRQMTAQQLLDYRQYLRKEYKDIRIEVKELSDCWTEVKDELIYRIDILNKDLEKLEKKRYSASTVKELAALDLN